MQALALYDEVRQSYAGLERVASAAARLRVYSDGQLAMIALPAFPIPCCQARFAASMPDIPVSACRWRRRNRPSWRWLSAQRYDLGLTESDAQPAGTRLELLVEVDEVCALPDGHPLLAREAIELRDFEDRPLSACRPAIPTACRSTRLSRPRRGAALHCRDAVSRVGLRLRAPGAGRGHRQSADGARLHRQWPASAAADALVPVQGECGVSRTPAEELVDAFAAAVREQAREMAGRLVAGAGRGGHPI